MGKIWLVPCGKKIHDQDYVCQMNACFHNCDVDVNSCKFWLKKK